MNVRHTEAVVLGLDHGARHATPVTAVCFGSDAEPVALAEQERELRIQAEGLLMQAEMLAWEQTGDFGAHGAATRHRARMEELIRGRSPAMQERMARERVLPHA